MLIYYFTTFRGTRKICRKHFSMHFKSLIAVHHLPQTFTWRIFLPFHNTTGFTWLVFSWRWCGFDRRGLVSLAYLHVCGPSSFNLLVWFCISACTTCTIFLSQIKMYNNIFYVYNTFPNNFSRDYHYHYS